ncbi:hypothetical protein EVAR_76930_1 [Eumeta japonica]|uniref:Uncharacterized protein n=1 Tax=Eumeta variegata TaxID=151549 RepID=A0A4C1SEY9_EUMVA|nr:hypothetical protein EVAR_76930_1 [Eumeta japonica]
MSRKKNYTRPLLTSPVSVDTGTTDLAPSLKDRAGCDAYPELIVVQIVKEPMSAHMRIRRNADVKGHAFVRHV